MTQPILYGIKNCDTVKKARQWLDANLDGYQFHDFRADGLTEAKVQQWIDALGLQSIVNKRSTTWKQCSEDDKVRIFEPAHAAALIVANPTIIKRPVLEAAGTTQVGFNPEQYGKTFN